MMKLIEDNLTRKVGDVIIGQVRGGRVLAPAEIHRATQHLNLRDELHEQVEMHTVISGAYVKVALDKSQRLDG